MSNHRLRALADALGSLLRWEIRHRMAPDKGSGTGERNRAQHRARKVRLTLERLGPFYIKIGQILSTRPDFVSDTMIQELRLLHDTVSVQPFSDFEPILRDELGERWRERFQDIDTDRPLGAASLAQVHAATLPDGQPVVVKIQRPGIAPLINQDMALLRRAAWLVAQAAPRFTGVIDVNAMLKVLFDAMRPELDFTLEAAQMNRARIEIAGFKHLDVPDVLLATPRVMIQTRAPGCSIGEVDPADFSVEERLAIGRDLLTFMYHSYFTTKVFHADPHPGNIFVHPGEKASLIDWGMVGRIDRPTSLNLLLTLTHLAMNDGQGVARSWIDLGHATDRADIAAFQSDMEALVPLVADASLETLNFGVTLTAVLTSATKHGIRTNPVIALLGKSFANLEGSIRFLAPELSLTDTFRDALTNIMIDLLDDSLSEQQIGRTLLELITVSTNALQHTHSIIRDLGTGQFQVRVNVPVKPKNKFRFAIGGAAMIYLWKQIRKAPQTVTLINHVP